MRRELISHTQRFAELREQWSDLLERAKGAHVFMTHEFLFTWWKHFAPEGELNIIAIWENEKLLSIAPLMLTQTRFARLPVRAFRLIGSGWGYGGIIYDQNRTAALREALDEIAASRHWQILELENIPTESGDLEAQFSTVFRDSDFSHETRFGEVPFISMTGTWEQYIAERSAKLRRNWRSRARKLEKIGVCTFMEIWPGVSESIEHSQIMSWLSLISSNSWKAKSGTAINSDHKVYAYYSDLIEEWRRTGRLVLCVLLVDDKPVSYVLGALFNGQLMEIDVCYDEGYSKVSPGNLARIHLVKLCFEKNIHRYDFVEYFEYKLELTSLMEKKVTYVVYRRSNYLRILTWIKALFLRFPISRLRNKGIRQDSQVTLVTDYVTPVQDVSIR